MLKARADDVGNDRPRTSELASARVVAELLGKAAAIRAGAARVAVEDTVWDNPRTNALTSPNVAPEVLGKPIAVCAGAVSVVVSDPG